MKYLPKLTGRINSKRGFVREDLDIDLFIDILIKMDLGSVYNVLFLTRDLAYEIPFRISEETA